MCHVLHLISEEEIHSHCLHSKHLAHSEPSGDPSLLCDNIPWELIIITWHERLWGSGAGVLEADWAWSFSGKLLTWILHPYENFPKRAVMVGLAFMWWTTEDGDTASACCTLSDGSLYYNVFKHETSLRFISQNKGKQLCFATILGLSHNFHCT